MSWKAFQLFMFCPFPMFPPVNSRASNSLFLNFSVSQNNFLWEGLFLSFFKFWVIVLLISNVGFYHQAKRQPSQCDKPWLENIYGLFHCPLAIFKLIQLVLTAEYARSIIMGSKVQEINCFMIDVKDIIWPLET